MPKVCCDCIGEDYLHNQIKEDGEVTSCDYCRKEDNPTYELSDLAELVHHVLEEHYVMTPDYPDEGLEWLMAKEGMWEQQGQPVGDLICDLLNIGENISTDILEYLSNQYDPFGKDAMIDPSRYTSESQYEEKPIKTYEFQESWSFFRDEIQTHARFFNQEAKSALDHLFAGIHGLNTYDGEPVVQILSPTEPIYRSRLSLSIESLKHILETAPKSLGAPPNHLADVGRMNAEGISVFYGATDIDTCMAEIRAPVGSYVVSGSFYPLRDLRVLDLTRLQKVYLRGSLFDSKHSEALSRVHFLKRLQAELSEPVMPGSEARDYLSTQAVAEYLALHPEMQLDGVMYASSQVGKQNAEEQANQRKNIVLFVHASVLKKYELPPGSTLTASYYCGDPNDPDPYFLITEEVPEVKEGEIEEDSAMNDLLGASHMHEHDDNSEITRYEASLKLDLESIGVRRVQGVSYQSTCYPVSR